MAGTSDWFFLLGDFSFLLVSKRTASNGRLLLRWTMFFPAFVVTAEAKQAMWAERNKRPIAGTTYLRTGRRIAWF
jgi:hypothetical protein